MKLLCFVLVPFLMCSCAASIPSPSATEIVVVAQKKCYIVKPAQPKDLSRPLPIENPKKLIDLLTNKLNEWAGPGGYGDKVERMTVKCPRR